MLMKELILLTHDFDNKTREWIPVDDLEEKLKKVEGLLQHALSRYSLENAFWYALPTVVADIVMYYEIFEPDNDISYAELEKQVIEDMAILEEHGLVRSRNVNGNQG